jgi:uncharacterized protein YndB with AHSA1/START domain/predicted enzyme related to lactoylglutathione lyase
MFKGLRTVAYPVTDIERAKRWYQEVLGKPPYFDQPFYVGFEVGGYELGLQPVEEAPTKGAARGPVNGPRGEVAYWGVDDVDEALARAVELGATMGQAAQDVGEGIITATVIDPFGNSLGVIKNLHFAPPLVHAGADDLSDRAIVKEARVALPPDEVFVLWSSSEGMASWWAEHSRIELRPGGFYELYFMLDEPPGRQGGEGCRVLSFVPGRMLSFSWNAPPHLPRTRCRHTWVVLEMLPEGDGCRLRLTHLGWPRAAWDEPDSQWPETFAYFDDAWGRVFERFEAKHGG